MKKGILIFIQRIFKFPVIGQSFKFLHVVIVFLGLAVASAYRSLHIILEKCEEVGPQPLVATGPTHELNLLSKRWRAERNLWISAFAFSAWCTLAAFFKEAATRLSLEEKVADMERSDITFSRDDPSREVTSQHDVTPRSASPLGKHRPSASPPQKMKVHASSALNSHQKPKSKDI